MLLHTINHSILAFNQCRLLWLSLTPCLPPHLVSPHPIQPLPLQPIPAYPIPLQPSLPLLDSTRLGSTRPLCRPILSGGILSSRTASPIDCAIRPTRRLIERGGKRNGRWECLPRRTSFFLWLPCLTCLRCLTCIPCLPCLPPHPSCSL